MKILWFTNTPSFYDQGKHHYHGGGWIESLEALIKEQKTIELAVSFFHKTDNERLIKNGTTYYPILRKSAKKTPIKTIVGNWSGKLKDKHLDAKFLKIINDFKPDIIQVFGTEGPFARVQQLTKIPVVIHIQGVINPCLNTYFPVNYSKWNFLMDKKFLFHNLIGNSPAFGKKSFEHRAKREQDFLAKTKYVMGRTHWDKMLAELYNPKVQYFHVDEVLRPAFYQVHPKSKNPNTAFKIISTLSPNTYKGIDVVLKTAKQLKELAGFDFEWEIIGLEQNAPLLKHFERTEKIFHKHVNIICSGRKSPEDMIEPMQQAAVFVHPSYIDNSPNSVCESQLLGLPVIACNVGGVSSLIQHKKTGFLVPSNGVFELVHYLKTLYTDKNLAIAIGKQAKEVALKRHDREKIIEDLLGVYSQITDKKNAETSCAVF